MNRFVTLLGALALFAVLAIPVVSAGHEVPSGYDGIFYLVPDSSSVSGYCSDTTVQVWLNSTAEFLGGAAFIKWTYCCANATSFELDTTVFDTGIGNIAQPGWFNFSFEKAPGGVPTNVSAGEYHLANVTLHCCDETPPCETNVSFFCEWAHCTDYWGKFEEELISAYDNGTFTCEAPQETFSKDLYAGWNLVSLPLVPDDNNSTSSVLASVCENVTAVFRYDAITKQFENVTDTTMDPGTGYFVHVTENCTWDYSGYAWADDIPLKQGLNMIGWLNCTKGISDALSSIAGDYYYAAKWDAVEQKFETYNPAAPNGFNDFFGMNRGTGYFISAKSGVTLSESCVA